MSAMRESSMGHICAGQDSAAAEKPPATIAIIDDNPAWIATISDILTAEGFAVLAATTAEDAIDLLDSTRPSLILLDVHVNGTSGLRLLADYRTRDRTTPVLVVSADDRALVRNQAMNMEAAGFLQKPITSQVLVRAIKRCLVRAAPTCPAAGVDISDPARANDRGIHPTQKLP